jgi:hypothetical protein
MRRARGKGWLRDVWVLAPPSVAGLAKLGHDPGPAFLEVFVDACLALKLKTFEAQHLANVINGEHAGSCALWL